MAQKSLLEYSPAQKKFEPARIDEWLRCLEGAACEICGREVKEKTKSQGSFQSFPATKSGFALSL